MAEAQLRIKTVLDAVTVRPGDTLIVRVDPGVSHALMDEFKAKLSERLPGVDTLVVGAEQILVYRPDADAVDP